jgi:predicted signal transduction protein with EAL and GGDEF domain
MPPVKQQRAVPMTYDMRVSLWRIYLATGTAAVTAYFLVPDNDQYGHQAGDRLLKSATSAWSRTLRTTDLLCGYGGEEFGVLPPAATTDQAAEVLERLRAVTPQGQTFSAGLAGWDGQEVSDELVARADRALCAAKAAGRDRIVVGNHQPTARDHQAAAAHPR